MRVGLAAGALAGSIRAGDGSVMDPTMSALVRFVARMPPPDGDLLAMRARYGQAVRLTALRPVRSVRCRDVWADGRPARLYEPPKDAGGSLLFFHGGGFIMGGLDTHDGLCRWVSARVGVRVLSVDYRLAPEHPFPAAHEDAQAALGFARARLPGPLAVGGDSAGANLAASLAGQAGVALHWLLYPVVDMAERESASLRAFGQGYLLTAEGMEACARLFVPEGVNRADPRLSPLRGGLGGAPAVLVVAGFDPLRDQGLAYGRALRQAGGSVQVLQEKGLIHGFADFAGLVPEARRAVDRAVAALRAGLDRAASVHSGALTVS